MSARASPSTPVSASVPSYGPNRFVVGANIPWVSYGSDFGSSAWFPNGGLHANAESRSKLDAALGKLACDGIKQARMFLLCDGRASILFERDGTPRGLDPSVFQDMDVALELAHKHGVKLTFAVMDFKACDPASTVNGVQLGGHADMFRNASKRKAYMERVLTPLLQRYGQHPDIEAWDVLNEPEWISRRSFWHPLGAPVWERDARAFLAESVALVHKHTRQHATVGLASTGGLPLVKGLGLDFYSAHWYDHFGSSALERPVSDLNLDRPLVLGEFPGKGSPRSVTDLMNTARRAGFGGAMVWSMLGDDQASSYGSSMGGWVRSNQDIVHRH